MPTMDFLSEYDPNDSESLFAIGTQLNAVMTYPNNWQLRKELIVFKTVDWEQIKAARIHGSPIAQITKDPKIDSWLSHLAHMQKRHIMPELTKRNHSGSIAGKRLYYTAGLEIHGLGGSFNKADELIPYQDMRDGAGRKIPTAKGSLHRNWRDYKDVAHLWVAEWIFRMTNRSANNMPEYYPEKLIGIAEWFRKFGEELCPGNTKKPILNPETTWKAPADFEFEEFDGTEFLTFDMFLDFGPDNLSKL